MNALNRRNVQNIALWRKFLLNMSYKTLKNSKICVQLFPKFNNMQFRTKYATKLKTVQLCIYMSNKNPWIRLRILGIKFKLVWKLKQSLSKK